jgi:hypothetical protein
MKADVTRTRQVRGIRIGRLAWLLLCALAAAQVHASTLLTDTTLVTGSQSSVFSFDAPGPGTVTVELSDINWPQPLSSLNFLASSGDAVLSSWSTSGSATQYFQIAAGGPFFADVTATAGGSLDVGVYSLTLLFTPAAPVPLPSAAALLLAACLVLLALSRLARVRAAEGAQRVAVAAAV